MQIVGPTNDIRTNIRVTAWFRFAAVAASLRIALSQYRRRSSQPSMSEAACRSSTGAGWPLPGQTCTKGLHQESHRLWPACCLARGLRYWRHARRCSSTRSSIARTAMIDWQQPTPSDENVTDSGCRSVAARPTQPRRTNTLQRTQTPRFPWTAHQSDNHHRR